METIEMKAVTVKLLKEQFKKKSNYLRVSLCLSFTTQNC